MRNTVKQSALASWTRLVSLVRTQARGAYSRDLNISQRVTHVQAYMLAKLQYTAQLLQPPSECLRQIISAIAWYILQGIIFWVPQSTLKRWKEGGGWGLIEVNIKCRAPLITRIRFQGQLEGDHDRRMAEVLETAGDARQPPHIRQIPPPSNTCVPTYRKWRT